MQRYFYVFVNSNLYDANVNILLVYLFLLGKSLETFELGLLSFLLHGDKNMNNDNRPPNDNRNNSYMCHAGQMHNQTNHTVTLYLIWID